MRGIKKSINPTARPIRENVVNIDGSKYHIRLKKKSRHNSTLQTSTCT